MENVQLEGVMDAILGLKSATEAGFMRVDVRLDKIELLLDKIEDCLDRIETRLDPRNDVFVIDLANVKNN